MAEGKKHPIMQLEPLRIDTSWTKSSQVVQTCLRARSRTKKVSMVLSSSMSSFKKRQLWPRRSSKAPCSLEAIRIFQSAMWPLALVRSDLQLSHKHSCCNHYRATFCCSRRTSQLPILDQSLWWRDLLATSSSRQDDLLRAITMVTLAADMAQALLEGPVWASLATQSRTMEHMRTWQLVVSHMASWWHSLSTITIQRCRCRKRRLLCRHRWRARLKAKKVEERSMTASMSFWVTSWRRERLMMYKFWISMSLSQMWTWHKPSCRENLQEKRLWKAIR